jgi:hypothetical protein
LSAFHEEYHSGTKPGLILGLDDHRAYGSAVLSVVRDRLSQFAGIIVTPKMAKGSQPQLEKLVIMMFYI